MMCSDVFHQLRRLCRSVTFRVEAEDAVGVTHHLHPWGIRTLESCELVKICVNGNETASKYWLNYIPSRKHPIICLTWVLFLTACTNSLR